MKNRLNVILCNTLERIGEFEVLREPLTWNTLERIGTLWNILHQKQRFESQQIHSFLKKLTH